MISVAEATGLILQHRPKRSVKTVSLSEAAGRTLARDVVAKVSKPSLPVSAMDGYAVRFADVKKAGAQLTLIGEAPAGEPFKGFVSASEAVRIFTGGVVPDGADHIVIQENVRRSGNTIECLFAEKERRHIRPVGLDYAEGDVVLKSGRRLAPFDLSIAASANHDTLSVFRSLKVALLSNGDELNPPGSTLSPGEIICSNPTGLGALLRRWGAKPIELGIASDSTADIEKYISSAPEVCEIFVAIGGASVGDHDHMRRAFQNAGFSMVFEKIAVRPGKPTWFAKRGDQIVLGLPGNPASALVCAHLFLRPLVHACDGLEYVHAKAAARIPENGPRETFMRATAKVTCQAILEVVPLPLQDSSLLTPFATANCLIRRTQNHPATEVGDILDVCMIRPISTA